MVPGSWLLVLGSWLLVALDSYLFLPKAHFIIKNHIFARFFILKANYYGTRE